jgi:hypothetical protein
MREDCLTAAGHSLVAQGALSAIPEPGTGLPMALGLAGVAVMRRGE